MEKLRRIGPLYLCLLIAALLWGCAGTDKVGLDLVEYVNQDILGIAQLESKALAHYGAATGPHYTDDETLLTALNAHVIPLYKRFLDLMRKVDPGQEEIRQLHAVYVGAAEDLYAGFNLIRFGLERKDETLILAANLKIENGRKKTEQWRSRLFSLYEAHGVKPAGQTDDTSLSRRLLGLPAQ